MTNHHVAASRIGPANTAGAGGSSGGGVGAGGAGPAVSAAIGEATTAVASATLLSRATRHSSDILEPPRFKPLGLFSKFVPQKSCLDYVRVECVVALPEIEPLVEALITAAREVTPVSAARRPLQRYQHRIRSA
jgi:hypothetical protein